MVYVSKLFSPLSKDIYAGDIDVESTVLLNEDGQPVEYLVVNQGIPENSPLYDSSCDGTWLLRKDIAENRQWDASGVNDYANSTIHSYLNSTFLNFFDTNVTEAIKQVKIPYRAGSGYGTDISSGENGLQTKIFLLSCPELNWTSSRSQYIPDDGACLSYFNGLGNIDSKRIAYLDGGAAHWWTRDPYCQPDRGDRVTLFTSMEGTWYGGNCNVSYGIRPALILPFDFVFQKSEVLS